jgi:hypothetical protein
LAEGFQERRVVEHLLAAAGAHSKATDLDYRGPMSPVSWIGTDGGPLVVLPCPKVLAWNGSYVPGRDGAFVT